MIILGSGSPRRNEIFSRTPLKYIIIEPNIKEVFPEEGTFPEKVMKVALDKARNVFSHERVKPDEDVVITADTIILIDDQLLGKPDSHEGAFEMLKKLNNRSHIVITGVAIKTKDKEITFHEETTVVFKNNTMKALEKYSKTKEVLDKAGSYAMQGYAVNLIVGWIGDYNNIIGLPLNRLCKELNELLDLNNVL